MSAESTLAEALARIEHKLDVLLSSQTAFWPAMGSLVWCPICRSNIEYQMDLTAGIVKRKCSCSTGMQPPVVPLIQPEQGEAHGRDTRRYDRSAEQEPERGPGRQER